MTDWLLRMYSVPRTLLPDYLTLSYPSLIDCRFKPLPQVAGALARWRLTGEFAGDPVMLHRAATLRPPGGVVVLGGCPLSFHQVNRSSQNCLVEEKRKYCSAWG